MATNGTSFVTITEGHTNPGGHGQYIEETIDDFKTEVSGYQDQLKDALDNIQATIDSIPPALDIPDVSDVQSPTSNFPVKPTFADLALKEYPDSDITDPVLLPYGDLEFEYEAPEAPSDISPTFNWNASEYTSDMWSALFSKVHGDIISGGTGLSDSVHDAIVSKEKESRRTSQNATYRKALDSLAADGFDMSSGSIAALQRDTARELLIRDQDALNALTIKDFDLATDNTKFAVTTGSDLEKLIRATWETANKFGFDAEKASADYLASVYELNIKKYIAAWEGIKLDLEAMKTKVDAISSANDGEVRVFIGKADVYKSKISAVTDINSGLVDTRNGEIKVYSTEVEAAAREYDGLVSEMNANLDKSRLEVMTAIEEGKLDLSIYTEKSKLALEASSTVGKITAQVIASTLGAINTSLSSGYSGSETASEHWGHSDSVSEGHSYEEK